MADALCGPSNALQNFQKHASVDRTLQQDRLTNRHSPAQHFRSSPGANGGILDSEFEAFQAGHAGPSLPEFHHFPSQLPPSTTLQYAQTPQAPDWASDFQRLNITSNHTTPYRSLQRSQAPDATSSWHQDFMHHQSPAVHSPAFHQHTSGGMTGYGGQSLAGAPFHQNPVLGTMYNPMSEVAQGKQQVQERIPEFDAAAFERAFAQAQQDMLEEANESMQEAVGQNIRPVETDPVLLQIRDKRLSVYTAIKLRSEIDLGRSADAIPWLQDLESLEGNAKLTEDASEAKWCVDALQSILSRDAPQDIKSRVETLIKLINERLMSTYPLLATTPIPVSQENVWEDLEAAGYTSRTPIEQVQEQPEQKESMSNDEDEMAETAGRLLERVADNTSEKFQNSQFLELMRRLRDREVRVEGDKVVEVSAQSSTFPSESSTISHPEPNPKILDYAHQDFGMVMDSEQEHEAGFSRTSTNETPTDEQFRYYNVNANYHNR